MKRSIQLGLLGFLKQVFSLTKFLESLLCKNSDIRGSVSLRLKSPIRINLS